MKRIVCFLAFLVVSLSAWAGEVPMPGTPVVPTMRAGIWSAADWQRPSRTLVSGSIEDVVLADGAADPAVAGVIRVRRNDGELFPFIVSSWTLILVRDRDGRLWVGKLHQLKAGWQCSVAFDIPEEDDEMPDLAMVPPRLMADNIVVDVP